MARLIDADALMQALGIFKDYEHGNPHFMNVETNRELVIGAPTIDAEPVRHGRWSSDDFGVWYCSECGSSQIKRSYFCPECGAKMDGGET